MKNPFMLMILDGFGLKESASGNAIKAAHTPNLDKIFDTYPNVSLAASGLSVGLPEGQMGIRLPADVPDTLPQTQRESSLPLCGTGL